MCRDTLFVAQWHRQLFSITRDVRHVELRWWSHSPDTKWIHVELSVPVESHHLKCRAEFRGHEVKLSHSTHTPAYAHTIAPVSAPATALVARAETTIVSANSDSASTSKVENKSTHIRCMRDTALKLKLKFALDASEQPESESELEARQQSSSDSAVAVADDISEQASKEAEES